jgi:hypothetical protein
VICRDLDELDAKAEERAHAAAIAGCDRLLELLRLHHPVIHRVPQTINETLAPGKKNAPANRGKKELLHDFPTAPRPWLQ